jgi:hypothetical protein
MIKIVSSLDDFLSLSLDAIRVLQLDLGNASDQVRFELQENVKLREGFFRYENEKEEILRGYEEQIEECRKLLEEEE